MQLHVSGAIHEPETQGFVQTAKEKEIEENEEKKWIPHQHNSRMTHPIPLHCGVQSQLLGPMQVPPFLQERSQMAM